ncbi:GNAT family N-acetyltransferase [Streptomyces sp. NPDC004610]|uniref:GNAT family N-acetyltransferase n=1 Tax=unclassified Streptomyces TaxID=2593676 RepID=UPI0033BAE611
MREVQVQVFAGDDALLAHTAALRSVYAAAFCAPPWDEDEEKATEFADRLPADARRPGFAAALAFRAGELLGFAIGWTTPDPFPADRCYPQAAAGLGPERATDWLVGALEIDELALRPTAQGTGTAEALLRAVSATAPGGRCWLLTSAQAPRAMSFYRRRGWTQATHPSPDGKGIVVFLGPDHPSRGLAARDL